MHSAHPFPFSQVNNGTGHTQTHFLSCLHSCLISPVSQPIHPTTKKHPLLSIPEHWVQVAHQRNTRDRQTRHTHSTHNERTNKQTKKFEPKNLSIAIQQFCSFICVGVIAKGTLSGYALFEEGAANILGDTFFKYFFFCKNLTCKFYFFENFIFLNSPSLPVFFYLYISKNPFSKKEFPFPSHS